MDYRDEIIVENIFSKIKIVLFDEDNGLLLKMRNENYFDTILFNDLCKLLNLLPKDENKKITIEKKNIVLLLDLAAVFNSFSNTYNGNPNEIYLAMDQMDTLIKDWLC